MYRCNGYTGITEKNRYEKKKLEYHQQIEERCLQSLNTVHVLNSLDALCYTWNSGTYDIKMYQEVGKVVFNLLPRAPYKQLCFSLPLWLFLKQLPIGYFV